MIWKKAKLGEVTDVISGTTPSSGNPNFWGGKYIWITPTDLGKLKSFNIDSSERRITKEAIELKKLPLVPKGSVVMSSRAPIGHIGIAQSDLRTNQGCKSFFCGSEIDPHFLYYNLRYRMNDIRGLGSGSTFSEVSKTQLQNFEIEFPEKVEDQKTIAAQLTTQLAEVEKAKEAVEMQLKELAQFRLKIQEKALKLLEGIPRLPLEHFLEGIEAGKSIKTTELPAREDELGVLKVSAVSWDKFQPDEAKAVIQNFEPKEEHKVKKGDLLLARANGSLRLVGSLVQVHDDYPKRLLSDKTLRLKLKPNTLLAEYLVQIFKLQEIRGFISENATGSQSMRNISQKTIAKFPIPDADSNKQKELIELFENSHEHVAKAENSLKNILKELNTLPQKILNEAFQTK